MAKGQIPRQTTALIAVKKFVSLLNLRTTKVLEVKSSAFRPLKVYHSKSPTRRSVPCPALPVLSNPGQELIPLCPPVRNSRLTSFSNAARPSCAPRAGKDKSGCQRTRYQTLLLRGGASLEPKETAKPAGPALLRDEDVTPHSTVQ